MGIVLPAQAAVPSKPNFVLIFIDDMGYGDIGPFGSTKNRTPHLDRMASEGMKFTSFYAAPVCSVSRSQVITGCYGQRVSIPGVFPPGCPNGINAEEHTVAELLKAQGYSTMCIGKWHLGDQPEFLPTRHGFDHYFGLPYSNDMFTRVPKEGRSLVPLMRDDKLIEQLNDADQDRLTERYTDEAVKFIRENRQQPFFLYLPHTAVHTPIHPGDKFRGKSANGRYGDWVEEVDWSVGRILNTLRELKLDGRTLVMFSSDNGPWLVKGADGGEAGPLRGGKGSTFEGGVREPTVAWWPGQVRAGSVCDAIAGNIDFLPTFVRLAGGSVPTDRKIDGRDISPLLLGQTDRSPHEARYYYKGYKLEAVRRGPWKLALGPQSEARGTQEKSSDASAPGVRLYNLDTDIGERNNVAAQHPDVVQQLQSLAVQMAAELGDGKPGPGVRPAGQVEQPALLIPGGEPRARKKSAGRTRSAASLDQLKIGDTLDADSAPQVAGQPLTITCQVEPKSADGVIVAHGGSACWRLRLVCWPTAR
jgi:arylsulfatase A-like enzyme